jgi:hypothetical protein
MQKAIVKIIIAFVVTVFSSCETAAIRLSVSGDSNPEFKVGGAAVLGYFGVEEIDPQTEHRIRDYPLWGMTLLPGDSEVIDLPINETGLRMVVSVAEVINSSIYRDRH